MIMNMYTGVILYNKSKKLKMKIFYLVDVLFSMSNLKKKDWVKNNKPKLCSKKLLNYKVTKKN